MSHQPSAISSEENCTTNLGNKLLKISGFPFVEKGYRYVFGIAPLPLEAES